MITVLRSAFALTLKEVQHHLLAVFFIAVWSVMMVPIAIVSALTAGGTSFAAAAVGLAYYYGPIVVMLVVRRIVVQEYEDGTIRFLDALPAPAWLQLFVKVAVGWTAVVGIVLGISLPMLGFAALREFVTFGWFLQLSAAITLYATAWLAMTMTVAQTGRFRHWIWLSMLVFVGSADLGTDWQHYSMLAALATTADATRHAFPWLDFLFSLAWTGLFAVTTLFLAVFRGGAIPAALFKSGDTRHRVTGTSWILALYIAVEVFPEVGAGTLNGWQHLKTPHEGIRVVGDARLWPDAARDTLDALDALHPLDPPTDLVLAADQTRLDTPPGPRITKDLWDRDELIVRVHGRPSTGDRARLVDMILDQRSAGMLAFAMDRAFAADGLGLYLAEPPGDRPLAERRAAIALRDGLTREDLGDWEALEARHGDDIAAGVGAIGLVAAESMGSRDKLGAWVGDTLLPVLPESTAAASMLGHVGARPAGVERSALHARWWALLQEVAAARADEIADLPDLEVTVSAPEDSRSNLDIAWVSANPLPLDAELRVQPLDPLRGRPVPFESDYRELVLPLRRQSQGQTVTWIDGTDGARATVRVWVPELDGWIVSGWTEVHR